MSPVHLKCSGRVTAGWHALHRQQGRNTQVLCGLGGKCLVQTTLMCVVLCAYHLAMRTESVWASKIIQAHVVIDIESNVFITNTLCCLLCAGHAMQTERAWASKIIRGQEEADQLPGVDDYLAAVKQRRHGAGRVAAVTAGGPGGHTFA